MLITTPLRRPREGWVPIPMTLMPSGVTSPTMQQIFVVPMSSPTTISPFFCAMVGLPLVGQGGGGLIRARRVVQIDPRRGLSAAAQRGANRGRPPQLEGDVAGAQPDFLHRGP